ncbi:DUF6538 domain-containing protein [Ruegeria sp. HKCCA4633]|uniref:DUF6538 domain-containing protein n=1 Tax=Ruegeria sp. HKCCA4633 TaxID=2682983 RepID=UPI001C2C7F67|nr:DUF6538 domain-containing protein [Ruegeria sp. HKCCA4633]
MTQPARNRPGARSRKPRYHAGPYLMLRGRIFYFRKRLPKKLSNQVPNQFLCLSLRTDLPLDAVKRAAALLTVLEQMEKTHVDALTKDSPKEDADESFRHLMKRASWEVVVPELIFEEVKGAERVFGKYQNGK